jgi:hypothetical protein
LLAIYIFNHVIFLQKTRTIAQIISKKRHWMLTWDSVQLLTAPVSSIQGFENYIQAFNGIPIIQDQIRKKPQKGTENLKTMI